jgi:hypothetical protein
MNDGEIKITLELDDNPNFINWAAHTESTGRYASSLRSFRVPYGFTQSEALIVYDHIIEMIMIKAGYVRVSRDIATGVTSRSTWLNANGEPAETDDIFDTQYSRVSKIELEMILVMTARARTLYDDNYVVDLALAMQDLGLSELEYEGARLKLKSIGMSSVTHEVYYSDEFNWDWQSRAAEWQVSEDITDELIEERRQRFYTINDIAEMYADNEVNNE